MRHLKLVALIINVKALALSVAAVVSMLLCRRFGLTADFPLALIATAIIFPIVFSIGGAYKRREAALGEYGDLKAHGRAIYFAARDWPEDSDPDSEERIKELLGGLLADCRTLFGAPLDQMQDHENAVYRRFSELSRFIKELRARGLASGEVSRCNQYLSKMIIAFEGINTKGY